jgi:hypothetical protein
MKKGGNRSKKMTKAALEDAEDVGEVVEKEDVAREAAADVAIEVPEAVTENRSRNPVSILKEKNQCAT